MTITSAIIRSFAALHTLEELQAFLAHAHEELMRGSLITTASSGAGASYARTITLPPAEAVELFQRAIELKLAGGPSAAPEDGACIETFIERSVC